MVLHTNMPFGGKQVIFVGDLFQLPPVVKEGTADAEMLHECFDADRMDLLRVGIMPVPKRMATKHGAELVSNPDYEDFYQEICEKTEV